MADWEVDSTTPTKEWKEPSPGEWEVAEQPMGPGAKALDTVTGLAKGVARGVEHFPGAAANMLGMVGRAAEGLGLGDPEANAQRKQFMEENKPFMLTDKLARAQSGPGKVAESIGEFAPASLVGPGGWFSRLATAVGGGAGAEAGSALTGEGSAAEPYARIIGGFIGGYAPTAGVRAANPLPADPHYAQHVLNLQRRGITDLTAGQRTGYLPLKTAEEHLGGSPAAGQAAEARLELPARQYTGAVLERIGVQDTRATMANVDRAHTLNGNDFDTIASRNHADLRSPEGRQYFHDINQAQADYDYLFTDPLRAPVVQNVVDHAYNKLLQRGTLMSGQEYKALRSRIERQRRGTQDPEVGQFLGSVRDAMDNLMERSMQRLGSPDFGRWQEVRNQYRNLLAVDKMVTGAQKGTGELISPEKVRQAAVSQNRSSYARGRGDFAELGRSGEIVFKGTGQSGTAPRALTGSGPLKLLTTGLTGRALMSSPVQAWLGNQRLNNILAQMPGAGTAAARSVLAEAPEKDNAP